MVSRIKLGDYIERRSVEPEHLPPDPGEPPDCAPLNYLPATDPRFLAGRQEYHDWEERHRAHWAPREAAYVAAIDEFCRRARTGAVRVSAYRNMSLFDENLTTYAKDFWGHREDVPPSFFEESIGITSDGNRTYLYVRDGNQASIWNAAWRDPVVYPNEALRDVGVDAINPEDGQAATLAAPVGAPPLRSVGRRPEASALANGFPQRRPNEKPSDFKYRAMTEAVERAFPNGVPPIRNKVRDGRLNDEMKTFAPDLDPPSGRDWRRHFNRR